MVQPQSGACLSLAAPYPIGNAASLFLISCAALHHTSRGVNCLCQSNHQPCPSTSTSPAAIVSPWPSRQLPARTPIQTGRLPPSASPWPGHSRHQALTPPHHLLVPQSMSEACMSACEKGNLHVESYPLHVTYQKDRPFGTIGYVGCFSPDAPFISKRNTRDVRHWTVRGPEGLRHATVMSRRPPTHNSVYSRQISFLLKWSGQHASATTPTIAMPLPCRV